MTTTTPTAATVLPLTAATDHRIAGHKAATLARLAAAGFPVPPGVVVPAVRLDPVDSERQLPAEIGIALLDAVRDWGEVPLAVRSSGVEEDSAEASYAGLFTTVLNVRGVDALLDAVRECWNSAFNPQVTSYSDGQPPQLAVLVQPMVPASAAGVAFTADPVTGDRGCVVIDAVVGIGERLVSGVVTPDRWVVRGDDAHQDSVEEQAIDAAQARSIADLAQHVDAELGGGPQDIEWAISEEKVILLQARPITALPIQPVPIPLDVPPGYWTREISHFPLPLLPFTDELTKTINSTVRRMATEFGLLVDGVEFTKIAGWEYVRVVPLGDREPPRLPGWLVPVAFRLVPQLRRRIRDSVAAMLADVPGRLLHQWLHEWQGTFDARIRTLRERQLATLSDIALGAHLVDALKLATDGIDVHNRLHGAIAVVLGEFAFTCRDLLGWDDARMFSLLCGTSRTSTEPARALADIAALATPKVRSLLAQAAPADEVLAEDEEFAAAVAAYLREYGCRTLAYELDEPSLDERPDLVLALVRDQLAIGFDPRRQQELAWQGEAAANESRAGLSGNDLQRFERTLQRALMAYPVREDNEFFTVSGPRGLLRRAALELGRRLASRGQIAATEDIFFLWPDEARERLTDGTSAYEVVVRRKGVYAWVLANPGPASYGRDPAPPPPRGLPGEARLANEAFLWAVDRILATEAQGGAKDSTVTGLAASPGRYTGTVRVIHSESEFGRLRAGDVLVCPVTSPVWSVLFPSLGALVTDSGGILSHPAIIAREFRVPAVVATRVGTSKQDGQVVTVDGSAGTVEILGFWPSRQRRLTT